jgi:mRNA interferase HicA
MKWVDLIKHLREEGCVLVREGKAHSVWENPSNGNRTTVPRHREISEYTARAICRQLGISDPDY